MLIFFPPWKAYAVSHHVHRKLQPVSRTNTHGNPARVPSPCTDLNISVMNIAAPLVYSLKSVPGHDGRQCAYFTGRNYALDVSVSHTVTSVSPAPACKFINCRSVSP